MNQALQHSHPVLLVDDEPETLKSFRLALRLGGIKDILCCQDSREVLPLLTRQKMEVILLDLTMPFVSGEELLSEITVDFPQIPVIIITGNNEIEKAVQCMKAKAFDYMVKPVEKSRLISGVKRAIEIRELRKQNRMLKVRLLSGSLMNSGAFSEIVTRNRSMLSLFQYAETVARTSQPVLITGETGVGKELMAKAIHTLSNHKGPLVSVNVAGIDDHVFSDTLFGHVKGAFTGADSVRGGLIEKASRGTFFLDEIGELNIASQIKLLRLLQEREYFPLGSDLPKTTDARIIVATNQDLEALQKKGQFRNDLYYRLRTHHLHIPPLRERLDDIPLLVDFFLEKASRSLGKKRPSYPVELISLLMNYTFPGNVRELEAMVYDAVSSHTSKKLSMARFRMHLDKASSLSNAGVREWNTESDSCFSVLETLPTLDQATGLLVAEALKRFNGNQSMAARMLGISRQRLARLSKA